MGKRKASDARWYYSFLPNSMAGGSTSPLIPLFITEVLSGSIAQVGLISAVTSMASVPSNILWGNLSDAARKRRMFVLIGFAGMAVALLMMGMAISVPQYLIANFVLGMLSTASVPVGTVLILESYRKEEWAKRLGDFSRVSGIGWLIGMAVGTAWLLSFGGGDPAIPMRALFFLAAGLALVSMFLAYRWVPEPEEAVDRQALGGAVSGVPLFVFERARYLPQRIIHVLRMSAQSIRLDNFPANLRKYYLFVFVMFTGSLCFYVALPIYLKQEVGMASADVFIIYLASSLVSALTYARAGRLVPLVGGRRLQAVAVAGRIVLFPAFFLVALVDMPFELLLLVFCALHGLVGLCWANIAVAGNHIVSTLCKEERRAESAGMYSAMQGIGTIAGAAAGGLIAQLFGYLVAFLAGSAFLAAGLVMLLWTGLGEEAVAAEGAAAPS